MKYIFMFFGILLLLACLVSAVLWGLFTQKSKSFQREARQGLDQVVAYDLPSLEGFETIKIVSLDSSNTVYGETCYYAGDFLILGGSLAEAEALDKYAAKLESAGWTLRGKQYPATRELVSGDHVLTVIRTGNIDPGLRDYVDYEQLRETYPSIIFVRIVYMLPRREGC